MADADNSETEQTSTTSAGAMEKGGASASEMVSILRTGSGAGSRPRSDQSGGLTAVDQDAVGRKAKFATSSEAPTAPTATPRRCVKFSEEPCRSKRSRTPPKRDHCGRQIPELEPEPELGCAEDGTGESGLGDGKDQTQSVVSLGITTTAPNSTSTVQSGAGPSQVRRSQTPSRVRRSQTPPKTDHTGNLASLRQQRESLAVLRDYHGDSSFGLGDIDKATIFCGATSVAESTAKATLTQKQFRDTVMEEAEQAFRTGDFGTLQQILVDMDVADRSANEGSLPDASPPVRFLDMYRVYMIKQMRKRSAYLISFMLYMIYMLLLGYLTLYVFPESSTMLRQREAVDGMFLNQEFSNNATSLVYKKEFADVTDHGSFWQFMYGPMVESIWTDPNSDEPGMILLSNFLIGAVQVRQVRVDGQNCSLLADQEERMLRNPSKLPNAPQICYPEFRLGSQHNDHVIGTLSTRSYGRKDALVPCDNNTATCHYHHSWHASSLKGSTTFATGSGQVQQFGNGGFAIELSRSKQMAVAQIASMELDYIDGATRAVAVSWNLYNPNEDIFTVSQVIFIFHPTGHVEPYARLAPLRLMRDFFFTNTAFESLAVSIMIVLVVYFFVTEVFQLLNDGPMVYFSEFWNLYELLDIWCFAKAIFAMGSYHEISVAVAEHVMRDQNQEHYYDMMASDGVRSAYRTMKMWMALNAMTAVLKVFKYLQISNRMNSLWEVLQRAFSDMLAFVIILLFILGGFAVFACVLFGDHVRSFHNIPSSMHTLLYFSIGDFSNINYELMKQANSALAPVFIGSFLVLVLLVALNMFIAILTDTYEVYTDEKKKEREDRHNSKKGDAVSRSFSVQKRLKTWVDGLKPYWKIQVKTTAPLLRRQGSNTIGVDDELLGAEQEADTKQIINGRDRLQTSIGSIEAGKLYNAPGSGDGSAEATTIPTRHEENNEYLSHTRPLLLAEGMKVRMHIGRSHVTKESVDQMREHARMESETKQELRLDPHAAPTLVEVQENRRRTPSSLLTPRFVSIVPDVGTEEGAVDGQIDMATQVSKGKELKRNHSLHFIDTTADDGDEEAQSMSLKHTVVLGMLTLRKSATEGYTMPSSTARKLICELRAGEEIEIRDRTEYLGDVATLQFLRVPPLVQTVAHDLMTGNDVIRRDTYAEFEVVKVHTLTPVDLQCTATGKPQTSAVGDSVGAGHTSLGVGCEIDADIAQLCLPYQLYARLYTRLACTWLGGGGWSVIAQSCKSWFSKPFFKLERLYIRRCTSMRSIEDLIEEFLDEKLRHVKSSRSTVGTSYQHSAYELMKRSYARGDVRVRDVAPHIRHANSRNMTEKLALARQKSHTSLQTNAKVREMKIAVIKYLDGTDVHAGREEPGNPNPCGSNDVGLMAIQKVDEYLRSKYGGAIRYEM